MSHNEEEIEGGGFSEGMEDDELLEPLDSDFAFEDEEEQDKN